MNNPTTYAATEAFSYLETKSGTSQPIRLLRHAATLGSILLILFLAVYTHFPKMWVKNAIGSHEWLYYVALTCFLIIKSFFVVESGGYLVHRYFEHVGFMSRHSEFFREGQKFHWAHHMIIYPLNKQYIKGHKYVDSQIEGIHWHWVLPTVLILGIIFFTTGVTLESFGFISMIVAYAKFNELVHSRFHIYGHSFAPYKYFQWLADIHILHHFDQETNFAITNPLMDILFGTYLPPGKDFQKFKELMKSNELNSADFINWHYLLTEASPIQYAQSIVDTQKYPGVRKKAEHMKALLEQFAPTDFYYQESSRLLGKLNDFLAVVYRADDAVQTYGDKTASS